MLTSTVSFLSFSLYSLLRMELFCAYLEAVACPTIGAHEGVGRIMLLAGRFLFTLWVLFHWLAVCSSVPSVLFHWLTFGLWSCTCFFTGWPFDFQSQRCFSIGWPLVFGNVGAFPLAGLLLFRLWGLWGFSLDLPAYSSCQIQVRWRLLYFRMHCEVSRLTQSLQERLGRLRWLRKALKTQVSLDPLRGYINWIIARDPKLWGRAVWKVEPELQDCNFLLCWVGLSHITSVRVTYAPKRNPSIFPVSPG